MAENQELPEPLPGEVVALSWEDIIAWMHRHWQGTRECPIDGSKAWGIATQKAALFLIAEDGTVDPQMGYPLVTLSCETCGYTLFFNAVTVTAQIKKEKVQLGGQEHGSK